MVKCGTLGPRGILCLRKRGHDGAHSGQGYGKGLRGRIEWNDGDDLPPPEPMPSRVARAKPARPAMIRPRTWLGHNLAIAGALFAAQVVGRREFAREVAAVLDYDCRDLADVTIHGESGRRAWNACGKAHVMALREVTG